MKLAFWILVFGFTLNLSAGLVFHYIPGLESSSDKLHGLAFIPEDVDIFTSEFNNTINPTSQATDTNSLIDNILDKLNLGIIKRMQTWANRVLFGFTDMIAKNVLKLDVFTMWIIKSLLIVSYVLLFINAFSGKDYGN